MERRREGLTSGGAEERERRGFVVRCVFRRCEAPHAVVTGNGHRRRLDTRGQAEGAKGAGAVFPRMARRNGGSSPVFDDAGGNRCRLAGRRTGGLGFRRAGIALGRFRDGNEQEEPQKREGYFREVRTQQHCADYILQAVVRQQLSITICRIPQKMKTRDNIFQHIIGLKSIDTFRTESREAGHARMTPGVGAKFIEESTLVESSYRQAYISNSAKTRERLRHGLC